MNINMIKSIYNIFPQYFQLMQDIFKGSICIIIECFHYDIPASLAVVVYLDGTEKATELILLQECSPLSSPRVMSL